MRLDLLGLLLGDLAGEAQDGFLLFGELLRVLQARELEQVDGNKTIKVDVALITATNHGPEKGGIKRRLSRRSVLSHQRLQHFPPAASHSLPFCPASKGSGTLVVIPITQTYLGKPGDYELISRQAMAFERYFGFEKEVADALEKSRAEKPLSPGEDKLRQLERKLETDRLSQAELQSIQKELKRLKNFNG